MLSNIIGSACSIGLFLSASNVCDNKTKNEKIQRIDKYLYRANGELQKDSKFKPNFVAYSILINVKRVLVLDEFKKSTDCSTIESDRQTNTSNLQRTCFVSNSKSHCLWHHLSRRRHIHVLHGYDIS